MYLRFWRQKQSILFKNVSFDLDLEYFYYFFSTSFNHSMNYVH